MLPLVCIVHSSPVVCWVVHLIAGPVLHPGAPCRHPRVLCDLRLSSRAGINTYLWTGLQSWYQHLSLAGSYGVARFRTSKPIETNQTGRGPGGPFQDLRLLCWSIDGWGGESLNAHPNFKRENVKTGESSFLFPSGSALSQPPPPPHRSQ